MHRPSPDGRLVNDENLLHCSLTGARNAASVWHKDAA